MKLHLIILLLLFPALSVAQEQAVEQGLSIASAKLGKNVIDREIADETTEFALNDRVYLWMRVVGGNKDSLTVTWTSGDQNYETKLYIGGSPWRTWAYKTAYTAGAWNVAVSDESGTVLKELSFTVSAPAEQ